jgi:hypothetical protein
VASDRDGVGQEGDDEDPRSPMRRSKVSGGNPQGAASIPEFVQRVPHRAQPSAPSAGDVLDDDEAGPELSDDAPELPPEAGALAFEPRAEPRRRDVLAGEASADETNGSECCRPDSSDIVVPPCVRPVLREDLAAERVDLDLPDRAANARGL